MNDIEFIRQFGAEYDKLISLRSDDDYTLDKEQYKKLLAVLAFFLDTARACGGTVKPVSLTPRMEHGGITAEFIVFDLSNISDLQRFSQIISYLSALTIDALTTGEVCIGVTVPNVYVKKEK